jgi:hypothetical protein
MPSSGFFRSNWRALVNDDLERAHRDRDSSGEFASNGEFSTRRLPAILVNDDT